MDPSLQALFSSAGAADSLRKYIANIGVTTTAIFAELGETIEEFDEAVVTPVTPLRKPVDLHDGTILELADAEFPVARARLRHVWKKCREAHAIAPPTSAAAAAIDQD